jgi:hypothetical protein
MALSLPLRGRAAFTAELLAAFRIDFRKPLRNIHKLFGPFLPENPHGYCVQNYGVDPD